VFLVRAGPILGTCTLDIWVLIIPEVFLLGRDLSLDFVLDKVDDKEFSY